MDVAVILTEWQILAKLFDTIERYHTKRAKQSMMTSSIGNIFRVTGPLWGEFTGDFPAQMPVMRSFVVFFWSAPE